MPTAIGRNTVSPLSTLAVPTRMSRRLDSPEDPVFVRLLFDARDMPAIEDAAHACRLSLASFARLALEMLAANQKVTLEEIRKEADRRVKKKRG